MPDYSKIAFISIGSNLGNPKDNVLKAIETLNSYSRQPPLISSLWKTEPLDCPPNSPSFVNAVVGIYPYIGETPEDILEKLLSLEKSFGRQPKKILNEPRPIDLDLITFGYETRITDKLVLPHPRATTRAFVLAPLNEIAPDFIFPKQQKTVSQLLKELPPQKIEKLE
ncbi:MAG: 2-amino-4-hydroxy-6-hydroxymethyldihydropteridine diphosphokinase [Limisphaerales bacterium]|jgi:2-amino-4-hydroxy-6-hydroxymethyldihydropteridine diphosphokinase